MAGEVEFINSVGPAGFYTAICMITKWIGFLLLVGTPSDFLQCREKLLALNTSLYVLVPDWLFIVSIFLPLFVLKDICDVSSCSDKCLER